MQINRETQIFFCWLAAWRGVYERSPRQLNHFVVITLYQQQLSGLIQRTLLSIPQHKRGLVSPLMAVQSPTWLCKWPYSSVRYLWILWKEIKRKHWSSITNSFTTPLPCCVLCPHYIALLLVYIAIHIQLRCKMGCKLVPYHTWKWYVNINTWKCT